MAPSLEYSYLINKNSLTLNIYYCSVWLGGCASRAQGVPCTVTGCSRRVNRALVYSRCLRVLCCFICIMKLTLYSRAVNKSSITHLEQPATVQGDPWAQLEQPPNQTLQLQSCKYVSEAVLLLHVKP